MGNTESEHQIEDAAFAAFPFHGLAKSLREGFRTRDGHILESGPVACWRLLVRSRSTSRPEPFPRDMQRHLAGARVLPPGLIDRHRQVLSCPSDSGVPPLVVGSRDEAIPC